jgi:sporulation protein YlmC with PRC-barrel domain
MEVINLNSQHWVKEDMMNKPIIDQNAKLIGYVREVTVNHIQDRTGHIIKKEVGLSVVKDPRPLEPVVIGVVPMEIVQAVNDVILLKPIKTSPFIQVATQANAR